ASAASVRALSRPPAKIGCVTAAASCQVAAAPPANRCDSAWDSLPRNAVSEIEGNISARATPMRAFAAASMRSASTRSGRRSSSSEGRPEGTAGASGVSSYTCRTSTLPSNTSLGLRPLGAHHRGLGLELAQLELRDQPAIEAPALQRERLLPQGYGLAGQEHLLIEGAQREIGLRHLRGEREAHALARRLARLELGARHVGAGAQAAEQVELVGHVQR